MGCRQARLARRQQRPLIDASAWGHEAPAVGACMFRPNSSSGVTVSCATAVPELGTRTAPKVRRVSNSHVGQRVGLARRPSNKQCQRNELSEAGEGDPRGALSRRAALLAGPAIRGGHAARARGGHDRGRAGLGVGAGDPRSRPGPASRHQGHLLPRLAGIGFSYSSTCISLIRTFT